MDRRSLRLQRLLSALGAPSRFRIVQALGRRAHHVSELAAEVGLSQSCTTRHLQALERLGVVRTARAGKRVVAELTPESAEAAGLLAWLQQPAPLDPRADWAPKTQARKTGYAEPPGERLVSGEPVAEVMAHAPAPDSAKADEPAPPTPDAAPAAWAEIEDFLL